MQWLNSQRQADIRAFVTISVLATGGGACSNVADSDRGATTRRVPTVAVAQFAGPVTTGVVTLPTGFREFDLSAAGYVQEEWFVSGTATNYVPIGKLRRDGRWNIQLGSSAAYRTRIIVRRPHQPSAWDGTVVVEWLNVSGPVETSAEWSYTAPALISAGAVYIALSAQATGVVGDDPLLSNSDGFRTPGIRDTNPQRYGSLVHPGDSWSYDIASQVAAALRSEVAAPVLGGRTAEHVILSGESQSAGFLVTYINAVQPLANAYDGFFVHSRGGAATSLIGALNESVTPEGSGARLRDDLDAPVLIFETETDVVAQHFASSRQRDTDFMRTWQVSGASQTDAYYLGFNTDACGAPLDQSPQSFVARAGMAALINWVERGEAPPRGERIHTTGDGDQTLIARDEHGIAMGGIRTPSVDVPIPTLSGEAPAPAPGVCGVVYASCQLDSATLTSLYASREEYLEAFNTSLDETIKAGFVRPEDADEYRNDAAQVVIPE